MTSIDPFAAVEAAADRAANGARCEKIYDDPALGPLAGVVFFKSGATEPTWHLTSLGLWALCRERGPMSFAELSLRVPRQDNEKQPPRWALELLAQAAYSAHHTRRLPSSESTLLIGRRTATPASNADEHAEHWVESSTAEIPGDDQPERRHAPLRLIHSSELRLERPQIYPSGQPILTASDLRLGSLTEQFGKLAIVQLYPLTSDEHDLVLDWSAARFAELLRTVNPHLLVERRRLSLLCQPTFAAEARRRAEHEGSLVGVIHLPELFWESSGQTITLGISRGALSTLRRMLVGRIRHGRECWIHGAEQGSVHLRPANNGGCSVDHDHLCIALDPATAPAIYACLETSESVDVRVPGIANLRVALLSGATLN
ncbi:MAG: suppressor of fused domain protein [Deltaproteobacteria bacterium]|nr:suppressor of fused domain protein [Deltaproteobacteria bacterium]